MVHGSPAVFGSHSRMGQPRHPLFGAGPPLRSALEYHQKVVQVRELTLSVPKESLGIALNNMGACYSRMGRFPEAHEAIDRALELLTDEDAALASAYST